MSSNPLEEVTDRSRRIIVGSILLYFALYAIAIGAGEPIALVAAELLFAGIALGLGALLYHRSPPGPSAILAAGICLFAGGVAQVTWLATGEPTLEIVTTVAVFVGVGLYAYAVWIAS